MSHRRVNKRTGAIAGAAAAALVGAAVLLPHANASDDKEATPRTFAGPAAAQVGTALADDLGGDAAGWFFDNESRRLVMNVLNDEAAEAARARGAEARIVENSMAELRSATRKLSASASIPGTAWSIDPKTNKVSVIADRTVTGQKMAQLEQATGGMAGMVSVKHSQGEFKPFAVGGDAIFSGGSRCSLGFNVDVGGAPGFLTAGHCGPAGTTWTSDAAGAQTLGSTAESVFPVADFSLVMYDDPATEAPSAVNLQDGTAQEITQAAEASVGMEVQRTGSTTGLSDGSVTGLDATVNYGNGDIVNGLIQTDVCAEPGDSGGAMFAGDAAVGLTSGGSGDCTQGGETFFQPVTTALEAVGATIGAGGGAGAGAGDGAGDEGAGDQEGQDGENGAAGGAGQGIGQGQGQGAGQQGEGVGQGAGNGNGAGDGRQEQGTGQNGQGTGGDGSH
ncbi:S1 family peptidase [Streptomyces zingiberis]|uniref:S1 family peptidase n=1 Tax=Streptomyces zingiberis TaxID=2053010 RepID=A0ABX1C4Q1_9ACTN|nr:S1 family peptidase [Streptomyces zingiberis]NJQ02619.1 S1 family peptidase [Streptomyces zingiberis]